MPTVPSAAEVRRRVLLRSAVASSVTVTLVAAYLVALLRLPAAQWVAFGWLLAGLFPVFLAGVHFYNEHRMRPLLSWLRAEARAEPSSRESLEQAYRCASRFPLQTFSTAMMWWAAGGLSVATGMRITFGADFGVYPFVVMVAGSITGGFASTVFLVFAEKAALSDLRSEMAARIPDTDCRRALQPRVSLAAKLRVSVTGVILVTTLFTVFLSRERSGRPLERNAAALQARFLERTADTLDSRYPGAVTWAAEQADLWGIARSLILLDARGRVLLGPSDVLTESERRALSAAASSHGTSEAFHSGNVFAWRRTPTGEIVVASTPWTALRGEAGALEVPTAVSVVLAVLAALGLAQALGRDVGHGARRLGEHADRMASGDLRRGRVLESEDELGDLARSFERMLSGLRETVGAVARAADEVDSSAEEIAAASQSVATANADQVRGAQQAAESMELINEQIAGVATSAQSLSGSVEEASSSILELGAASEQLNGTAGVLFSKVEEVTTSLGEAGQSVRHVAETTESLGEASAATTSSMEEMAASMGQVDATAEETAAISRQMMSTAEAGRDKVRQTIEGMDSIRQATEAAEGVIRGLGRRTQEIGAILDVIDSVADETNLLALNAAIIAAQAGEHGRGFAVVADEIKELADRVLSSTKEIGGLVHAVQAESQNAVGAIERGASSVAEGVGLSAEAGEALEEITRASRESGERIQAIVAAVREQTRAAGHVVELMERTNEGVARIRNASTEQERGNRIVFDSATAMRDIAQQVRSTTQEQTTGARGIRLNIEAVRGSVEAINAALQDQAAACGQLSAFLEKVSSRTRTNEDSVSQMADATRTLATQADGLRDAVRRFRL